MTDKEFIDQYLAYINDPKREKEAEVAERDFIQAVMDDIYGPYTEDAKDQHIEGDRDDKNLSSFILGIFGFGLYALTHLPKDEKLPLSNETLDKMWSAYRAEHEDYFTDVIHVTTELSDLNSSEDTFRKDPQLYPIFDYWKDKVLLQELPEMLSPENLISWSSFEFVTMDMFYDLLEVEFGIGPTSELDESILDTDDSMDLMGKLMHIVSPFMFLMLRYAYYQTWLKKTTVNDDFRRNRATANYISDKNGLRLIELHDVNTGGMPAKRIYKNFANLFSQSIKGYLETTPRAIDENNIDVLTYISMAQLEVSRLGSDESFLREHCQSFFVDSLIEWHRGYFAYLINEIHKFNGYEKFQIPEYRIMEVKKKKKIIEEPRALTPLGMSCRKAIIAKIRECRTTADFGALLYKFQHELKFFTKGVLSQNECYLCMQQMGKVHFDSSGDFSNCNKGYNLAKNRASKK